MKKKENEEKEKKIVKVYYVCVCIFFYECFIYLFMIKLQRLKKNLIF